MSTSVIRGPSPAVHYRWFNEWRGEDTQFYAFSKHKKTAHKPRPKINNLLDHINFFPSKEEGRIPGERKSLSEIKTKQVDTCAVCSGSHLCSWCTEKVRVVIKTKEIIQEKRFQTMPKRQTSHKIIDSSRHTTCSNTLTLASVSRSRVNLWLELWNSTGKQMLHQSSITSHLPLFPRFHYFQCGYACVDLMVRLEHLLYLSWFA